MFINSESINGGGHKNTLLVLGCSIACLIRDAFNERTLSGELDFFFDNVLDTVVDYFTEKEMVKL